MQLEERRRWQMNYRLIYRLYTSSTDAIFDDLIDVDITPLNANTDDLFSFSGRKCTIRMPYDDNAKSLFYDDDNPNDVYPDYMRGQFDLVDLDDPGDSIVFRGMAKLEFIEIDELRSEIKLRLSDALDVWIDIAKRTDFTVPEGGVKTVAMRVGSGDYTVVDFMQEIMTGFPTQMRDIDLFHFLAISAQNVNLIFNQYANDFMQWQTSSSLSSTAMFASQFGAYVWQTELDIIKITLFWVFRENINEWGVGQRAEIRAWSAKVYLANPFQPIEEDSGYIRNIVNEADLKLRIRNAQLYPANILNQIDGLDLSKSPLYGGDDLPFEPFYDAIDHSIGYANDVFNYSGYIQLDPVTIPPGSYNYAKILRAMIMANRLAVFSGQDAITIKQHLIDPTADTLEATTLSDDDITHLQIRGTLGKMNTLDDISALGGARALIVPLQQIYRNILGNFRKQISFSVRSSIANNLQMFSKISIGGKVYFVTSIGHPEIDGTSEIIAIGER
jgi:hypothetical protein